jgi:Enoyl-(Acyl carrier protein) reductase
VVGAAYNSLSPGWDALGRSGLVVHMFSLRKRTQESGSLLHWGRCRVDGRGNNEIGLTKVLALEVAEHGITSNAICPADVRTPLVERQIEEQARQHQISRDDVIRKITTEPAAIHRLLNPEEVSALGLHLCSEQASGITGAALDIDLGWTTP